MTTTVQMTAQDRALTPEVVAVARRVGERLLAGFSTYARPVDRDEIMRVFRPLGARAGQGVRETLSAIRPQAGWIGEDEEEQVAHGLPPGEWWLVDTVDGAINLLHGLPDWCVSITLVRDDEPVLGVIYQPTEDAVYTAVRGAGAQRNGVPLRASAKRDLSVAMVTTSQDGGETDLIRERIARSFTVMMREALLVRNTIPTTLPLIGVAAGHFDAYWQFAPELSGVGAGVLLATEAGAIASDLHGAPWRPGRDLLVAAPGLHAAALAALSSAR